MRCTLPSLVQLRLGRLELIEDLHLLGPSLHPFVHLQIRLARAAEEVVLVVRVSMVERGELVWQSEHEIRPFGHASDDCSGGWVHRRFRQEVVGIHFLADFGENANACRVVLS